MDKIDEGLNSLVRTLAERYCDDYTKDRIEFTEETLEAVILEAIDKTLEIAARTVGTAKSSHGCDDFIIRNDAEDAIRSLKQSNSGRAEQGISEVVK